MPAQVGTWRSRLTSVGVTVCGILLALFPLALWVAWTPSVFAFVFAVGVASAALLLVLLAREPKPEGHERNEPRPGLPASFVEELHGIFPLTYHHSRRGRARYRRAMARLRRELD